MGGAVRKPFWGHQTIPHHAIPHTGGKSQSQVGQQLSFQKEGKKNENLDEERNSGIKRVAQGAKEMREGREMEP